MKRTLLTLALLMGCSLSINAQVEATDLPVEAVVIDTVYDDLLNIPIEVVIDNADVTPFDTTNLGAILFGMKQGLKEALKSANVSDSSKAAFAQNIQALIDGLEKGRVLGSDSTNSLKELVQAVTDSLDISNAYTRYRKKVGYGYASRAELNFLWAFTNWGNEPWSGLLGTDGPSALGTTFSSYQLEYSYAVVMVPHWQVKVGLGYESDVYHFANPYVTLNPTSGFVCSDGSTSLSSKLVTRYATLPIGIAYRSRDYGRSFTLGVSAIPGLTLSGKNSGMKYRTPNGKNTQSVATLMNPFKCDLRFDIGLRRIALFLQVPLLPVLDPSLPNYYPIKIGLKI